MATWTKKAISRNTFIADGDIREILADAYNMAK